MPNFPKGALKKFFTEWPFCFTTYFAIAVFIGLMVAAWHRAHP